MLFIIIEGPNVIFYVFLFLEYIRNIDAVQLFGWWFFLGLEAGTTQEKQPRISKISAKKQKPQSFTNLLHLSSSLTLQLTVKSTSVLYG